MRNLFLLTALALSLSLTNAQDGGFFGGITNAFNNFFSGNPRPQQPQRRPPQQFQQQQFQQQQQQQQQFFQPQPQQQQFQPQQQQQFRPRPAQGSFQQAPVFQPQPQPAQQPQVIRQPLASAPVQPPQNRWERGEVVEEEVTNLDISVFLGEPASVGPPLQTTCGMVLGNYHELLHNDRVSTEQV